MGLIITGIDPGPESSAWAEWDGEMILSKGIIPNEKMLGLMRIKMFTPHAIIVIEGIQSFGRIVGRETFNTCIVIGRLLQAAEIPWDQQEQHLLYRPAIKAYLLGTVRGKDKDIRSKLISILGHEVTYGVSSHVWSALAVAYVAHEVRDQENDLKKRKLS